MNSQNCLALSKKSSLVGTMFRLIGAQRRMVRVEGPGSAPPKWKLYIVSMLRGGRTSGFKAEGGVAGSPGCAGSYSSAGGAAGKLSLTVGLPLGMSGIVFELFGVAVSSILMSSVVILGLVARR